jgi:ankyrin repeat protein
MRSQEGAEVNAQDMEGNTPFDWADDYGHGECAVLLWRNGAQIKTQTGKRTLYPDQRLTCFALCMPA